MRKLLLAGTCIVVGACYFAAPVKAQILPPILDPLHLCYNAPLSCNAFDGVSIASVTTTGFVGWGISSSPAPQTGLLSIALLIPSNDTEALLPTLTGEFGGTNVLEAGIVSKGFFSNSADLGSLFGGTAPPNPIASYQAATAALDPGYNPATMGYNVWLITVTGNNPFIAGVQAAGSVTTGATAGQTNVLNNSFTLAGGDFHVGTTGPLMNGLPEGTIITAFLDETIAGNGIVSTAQSSSLVDATPNQLIATPEPASLALLGVGLLGTVALTARRRRFD